MTNLTEQYRKGELPSGWYYVRDEAYQVYPAQYIRDYDYIKDKAYADFPNADNLVVDVLCECPKYDEYITAKKMIAQSIGVCDENSKLKEDYNDLRKQKNEADNVILEQMAKVRQLKELLKQARGCVAVVISRTIAEVNGIDTKKLLAKIDQVLQENK